VAVVFWSFLSDVIQLLILGSHCKWLFQSGTVTYVIFSWTRIVPFTVFVLVQQLLM